MIMEYPYFLDDIFGKAIEDRVFPGAVAGISFGSPDKRKRLTKSFGYAALYPELEKLDTGFFFDLASLTKPFAASLGVLCLIKEKKCSLNDTLAYLLETEVNPDKRNITLFHLLNHCSGLPAYRPYYERLATLPDNRRKDALKSYLMDEPLEYETGKRAVYSDLGYMIAGWIIEKKSGMRLDNYVKKKVFEPFGLAGGVFFRPFEENMEKGKRFAATEDCKWRGRVLKGEVHDDNTFAVGGVSGQAGLFGDIQSLLDLTEAILDQWKGRAVHPNYDNADLINFLTRQNVVKESSWAIGFDTPSATGSSGGQYLSKTSVGHLGFTGTSFWIDPEKELVMVLLTNRVHPDRGNIKIREFRPLFHDTVIHRLGL